MTSVADELHELHKLLKQAPAAPTGDTALEYGWLRYRRAQILLYELDPPEWNAAYAELSQAKALLRRAAPLPGEQPTVPEAWLMAWLVRGRCCALLYDIDVDPADAEEAIEAFRAVQRHRSLVDPVLAVESAARLAQLFLDQANQLDDFGTRLAEAADLVEFAVSTAHDDDQLRADALVVRAHVAMACARGGVPGPARNDDELRTLLRRTLDEVPGHHRRWTVSWELAAVSYLGFEQGRIDLLDDAVEHYEDAMGDDAPPQLMVECARALATRWEHDGPAEYRDRAIGLFAHAAEQSEPDPLQQLQQGLLRLNRYARGEGGLADSADPDRADLDLAVDLLSSAMGRTPDTSDVHREAESGLIEARVGQLNLAEDAAAVDDIIGYFQTLFDQSDGDPDRSPRLRACLGFAMRRRFEVADDREALRSAIDLLAKAYRDAADDDNRHAYGIHLAGALIRASHLTMVGPDATIEAARLLELHGGTADGRPSMQDSADGMRVLNELLTAALTGRRSTAFDGAEFDVPLRGTKRKADVWQLVAGTALLLRHADTASVRDLEASGAHFRDIATHAEPGSHDHIIATAMEAVVSLASDRSAPAARASGQVAAAVDRLSALMSELPETGPEHAIVSAALALAKRRAVDPGQRSTMDGALAALDSIAQLTPAILDQSIAHFRRFAGILGALERGKSFQELKPAVDELRTFVAETPPDDQYLPGYQTQLGIALMDLYQVRADPGHLLEATNWFDAASRAVIWPHERTVAAAGLAGALRLLAGHDVGVRPRSRAAGIDAIRKYAQLAVLQSSAADAAELVRDADRRVGPVVRWCLEDGAWADAVRAIEAGRALTLNAALTWASVPQRLRARGQGGLADEWEREQPGGPARATGAPSLLSDLIPHDLPARVVAALGDQVDAPPHLTRIGAALRELGQDALIYLVPDAVSGSGHAVIVRPDSTTDALPLPGLADTANSPVDRYHAAHDLVRATTPRTPERDQARQRWRAALDELLVWAWTVVMDPVLRAVSTPARLPRVVIVPVGRLSGVPWHAAHGRHPDPGMSRPRYALDHAVISYSASARLLVDCAARPPMPQDGPALIIGNPTDDPLLGWAAVEATALWRGFYQDADYYGRVADLTDEQGPALALRECTHNDLLAGLPGGRRPRSVVHVSCHAGLPAGATSVLDARLRLGPGGLALSIERILRQAAGRPVGSPGPLVGLAGCGTHLTGDQHDEALTLSTAFQVAGASTVLGSLWRVTDRGTALLMFVVHHHLRVTCLPAADAVRAAQLWMLNPNRRPLPDMPPVLAAEARGDGLTAPYGWAAFVHQGR